MVARCLFASIRTVHYLGRVVPDSVVRWICSRKGELWWFYGSWYLLVSSFVVPIRDVGGVVAVCVGRGPGIGFGRDVV